MYRCEVDSQKKETTDEIKYTNLKNRQGMIIYVSKATEKHYEKFNQHT